MADRLLLESGSPDGYQLEDGSGVVLLDVAGTPLAASPPDRSAGTFGTLARTQRWYTEAAITPVILPAVVAAADATVAQQAALWAEQPQDWTPQVWYTRSDDDVDGGAPLTAAVPAIDTTLDIALGTFATLARTQRWITTESTAAAFVPPVVVTTAPPPTTASVPEQAALWQEQPGQERPHAWSWFTPDASIEGLGPPAVTPFDPATGFDWSEQPTGQVAVPWLFADVLLGVDTTPAFDPALVDFGYSAQQDRSTQQVWYPQTDDDVDSILQPAVTPFNPATGFDWSEQPQLWLDGTPWYPRTDEDVDGSSLLPNAYAGSDIGWDAQHDRDLSQRWFTEPDDALGIPPFGITSATAAQDAGALHSDAEQRDLAARWYQEPDDSLGAVPIVAPPATVDQQSPALQPEQRYVDLTQFWFQPDTEVLGTPALPNAPTEATLDEQPQSWRDGTPWFTEPDDALGAVPIVAGITPDQLAALWSEQPGQDASLQPTWFQPSTESLGTPLANAYAGSDLGWDASQDRSTQPVWFQPETESWTPIPGLTYATVAQTAAVLPDASGQQDASIQPVWFAPEPTADSSPAQLITVIVTGGRGPDGGSASGPVPFGWASASVPSGSASSLTPPTSGR